jgi:membrane protein implicated in regulation of membrane protease activity
MFELFLFNNWFWLGLTVLLVILEVILGTSFFLLWLALVAFAVGIVIWIFPVIGWQYQTLLFAAGSIASILFWGQYLKGDRIKTDKPTLNRRSEEYIGRTFSLVEPIVNGRGRIKVGDTHWQVEGSDLPAGAPVKVIAANGTLLQVEPVTEV